MPRDDKLKLAVLASGRGSNFQALIDACEAGGLNVEIVLLLTDNPAAGAIERARKHGAPYRVIERREYRSREEFDSALADAVEEAGADLVCLAGFMRILSPEFLSRMGGWVINIHPALLPSFPGLDAQKQALDAGVRITGATVHFVDEGVDTGPIITQAAVPVEPGDTVETLSARILEKEHEIYPEAVRMIAAGEARPPEKQAR
ncbi:MAG: phosphoribosylglycinamide formyltransferase [Candidatus Nitrospinota bacterium M3_3B_026]